MMNMVEYAQKFIGIPYKLGGNVPQDGGMDCSGFVLEVLRAFGKWGLKDDTAHGIYLFCQRTKQTSTIQKPGMLLFWGTPQKVTHVSIATGDGYMIEAGGDDKTGMVRMRPVKWRSDLVAGYIV